MPMRTPSGDVPPASARIVVGLPSEAARPLTAKSIVGHPQPHRETTLTHGNCPKYVDAAGVP
jgi:hypothetical protein